MTDQPHSSWAAVYDLAYERSFGGFYRELTRATLDLITERVRPPARVVDFGAGTGRLSLPLAELGYRVTAVEPCLEMLNELKRKHRSGALRTVQSTMADFRSDERFDLALCVFTVVLYLLDEQSLRGSLAAAHASLEDGGLLLIDIPSKLLFQGLSVRDQQIERTVSVSKQAGDVFTYQEDLTVKKNGEELKYRDSFPIRYWPQERVMAVLREVGFFLVADLSDQFSGSGSQYYIMRKAEGWDQAGSV